MDSRSLLQENPSRARSAPKPSSLGWRTWAIELLAIITAASIFAWLANHILAGATFSWDTPIILAVHQYRAPWLDTWMIWVSNFGLPRGLIVIALCLWLWYKQHRTSAITILLSYGGSYVIPPVVKLYFTRQRPSVVTPLEQLHDFSFPSGHTLGAITLYGLLAYLCWQHHRYAWALLCLFPVAVISYGRVYLGVHYPSDVLGAIALGITWAGSVLLVCRLIAMYTQNFNPVYIFNKLRFKSPAEEP